MISGILEVPVDAGRAIARLRTGLWRRQFDDFTLLSFHPEILQQASQQLRFEKRRGRPKSGFMPRTWRTRSSAGFINAYGYRKSRQSDRRQHALHEHAGEQLRVCRLGRVPGETGEATAGSEVHLAAGRKVRSCANFGDGLKNWVSTAHCRPARRTLRRPIISFPALTWLAGPIVEIGHPERGT